MPDPVQSPRSPFRPGLLPLAIALVLPAAARAAPLLERDVLPILTRQCLACHGGLRKRGGLDLRTPADMLRGGDSGPAVKPGDLQASPLWRKVQADKMPPGEKKLSAEEKSTLRRWIAAGMPPARGKEAEPLSRKKHSPAEVALAIDREIDLALKSSRLTPAPRAGDDEFLRRAYLDLAGRVPTAEQSKAFLDDKSADKRARLIDALLDSPRFGEQLGRTWRDWICPPELPSDGNGGGQPHREAQNFGLWLGKRFSSGDSWDRITRDVLTVEGEIKNKPQVIFFGLVGEGGNTSAGGSARAVASLFMGVQLQCAQCHDDPYRTWAQKEFWSLAAFFARTSGNFSKITDQPAGPGKGPVQITIPRSAFKNAGASVPAAFPGGKVFALAKEGRLRSAFVDWLTARDNPFFARAFANRTWFYFFARGIVKPVDDFRDLNPPSHPALMYLLANEFTDSGFDVKHLVRCICNSKTYQRTSRVAPGTNDRSVDELTAAFGRMPLRIMTADQLYDSLRQAYGDPKLDLRNIDAKG
jgi:hypothetical protein